mgnify:CR=1 FL=1
MFPHSLFLAAALLCTSFQPATVFDPGAKMLAPVGGPPRIRLATKTAGDITKLEWSAIKAIELQGCVPDARITSLTICIMDCTGKDATATGSGGTISTAMRTMIANLPAGTPFTVKVVVMDAKGNVLEVPDANYTWRG